MCVGRCIRFVRDTGDLTGYTAQEYTREYTGTMATTENVLVEQQLREMREELESLQEVRDDRRSKVLAELLVGARPQSALHCRKCI